MKAIRNVSMLLIAIIFSAFQVQSQDMGNQKMTDPEKKTYVFERDLSEKPSLTKEELNEITVNARALVQKVGPEVEWVHSYVTDDKMICIFKYENESAVAEHAAKGGFSVNDLKEVTSILGPDRDIEMDDN
jgi:hypothetical protein